MENIGLEETNNEKKFCTNHVGTSGDRHAHGAAGGFHGGRHHR